MIGIHPAILLCITASTVKSISSFQTKNFVSSASHQPWNVLLLSNNLDLEPDSNSCRCCLLYAVNFKPSLRILSIHIFYTLRRLHVSTTSVAISVDSLLQSFNNLRGVGWMFPTRLWFTRGCAILHKSFPGIINSITTHIKLLCYVPMEMPTIFKETIRWQFFWSHICFQTSNRRKDLQFRQRMVCINLHGNTLYNTLLQ